MDEYVHCYKSHNIRVDIDINFIDSFSLKLFIKQLKTIKEPNKNVRDLIKNMENLD